MRRRSLLAILCTVFALFVFGCSDGSPDAADKNRVFLVDFDRADLERMKELVERFNEQKGDCLIAIPPIVDGDTPSTIYIPTAGRSM